jgi:DnaK suppressor protein
MEAKMTKKKITRKDQRNAELKKMLEARRRELIGGVRNKILNVRVDARDRDGRDELEFADAAAQDDIEIALINMNKETLQKINAALDRLEKGTYGDCFECGQEISELRLRALAFAVRCKDCEELREDTERRQRAKSQRGIENSPLFQSNPE